MVDAPKFLYGRGYLDKLFRRIHQFLDKEGSKGAGNERGDLWQVFNFGSVSQKRTNAEFKSEIWQNVDCYGSVLFFGGRWW